MSSRFPCYFNESLEPQDNSKDMFLLKLGSHKLPKKREEILYYLTFLIIKLY